MQSQAILSEEGAPAPSEPSRSPDTGEVFTRAHALRFSIGFVVLGLLWTVGLATVSSVLLPQRLKDIGVSSPDALLGTVNSITALISLLSNLVFGNLSDRSRFRMGRRAPWIFSGTILAGVTLFLVGIVGNPVLLTVSYCFAMVGLNMMLAPAVAVLSDRVPLSHRGTMSAFYGAGTTVGFALGALVGARYITDTTPGFVLAGIIMAVSGGIALAIWPREPDARSIPRTDSGSFKDLLVSFRPPRNAPDFYKAFVGRLLMLLSYQMIFAYQLYIVQDYVGQSTAESGKTIATMSVITLVVSIVAPMISGPLSDKLGRRKVPVVAASVLFAIGIAMPWVLPTVTGMYLFSAIAGFGYGVYTAVDQALNVDVLPSQEEAGKDLGILNLGTTLGQMVGPIVTSSIVVLAGGYSFVFPVSIVAALAGAVVITRIKSVK